MPNDITCTYYSNDTLVVTIYPVRLAEILAIMSVLTFKIAIILYLFYIRCLMTSLSTYYSNGALVVTIYPVRKVRNIVYTKRLI